MSEDQFWHHAGVSRITTDGGSYTVRIPDRLFREDHENSVTVLKLGSPVYWSVEATVGLIVVSKQELSRDEYKRVEYRKFEAGDSQFACTVPKEFFPDFKGRGNPATQPDVVRNVIKEKIQLEEDDLLHFIYHTDMIDSDVKSCYALTGEQFDNRFADSDRWDGKLEQVPRFIS